MGPKPGWVSHPKPPMAFKKSFAKHIYRLHPEAQSGCTNPSHPSISQHIRPAPEESSRGYIALGKMETEGPASPYPTWWHLQLHLPPCPLPAAVVPASGHRSHPGGVPVTYTINGAPYE